MKIISKYYEKIDEKGKERQGRQKNGSRSFVEHLEKDLDTELHKIKWFGKEISEAKAKVTQTRKVLEKLRKLK